MHAIPYFIMEIPSPFMVLLSSFMKISSPLMENPHLGVFFFFLALSKPNGLFEVAKEGLVWAKIGDKFCKVNTCNVSYATKWLF